MKVRAKFRCDKNEDGEVYLTPVVGGSAENDRFYHYTPGGKIELVTINAAAAAEFVVGEEYYVDFKRASSPMESPVDPAPAQAERVSRGGGTAVQDTEEE